MKEARVFLSYVAADQEWANLLASALGVLGVTQFSPQSTLAQSPGAFDAMREAIHNSSHIIVLLGPATRRSRWVDREIELSTELRENGPGASVIGVKLPSHPDHDQPYYDPENVPIRLHDLVQNEYAIIRKWSDKPEEIQRWLDDALRRRQSARSEPSLRAAAEIYRFAWDQKVDAARPDSEAL